MFLVPVLFAWKGGLVSDDRALSVYLAVNRSSSWAQDHSSLYASWLRRQFEWDPTGLQERLRWEAYGRFSYSGSSTIPWHSRWASPPPTVPSPPPPAAASAPPPE